MAYPHRSASAPRSGTASTPTAAWSGGGSAAMLVALAIIATTDRFTALTWLQHACYAVAAAAALTATAMAIGRPRAVLLTPLVLTSVASVACLVLVW